MEQPNNTPEKSPSPTPIPWEKGAAVFLCLAAGAIALWLGFRYIRGILLPFLLAYLLSRLIRPLLLQVTAATHLPRWLVAAGMVGLLVGGLVLGSIWGLRRGWSELTRLAASLAADPEGPLSALEDAMSHASSLSSRLPFLSHLQDSPQYEALCAGVDHLASEAVTRATEGITSALPAVAKTAAEWVPAALIFITVTLLACYYFSADDGALGEILKKAIARVTPPSLQDKVYPLGRRLSRLGRQYLRAYLFLGFLTFLQAFIGLAVLKIPYAFLLALAIAIVDVLPLLGTGVILIPWALIALLTGNVPLAIGLGILYGITTAVRQILEPKLIGDGLGLHPLLSLVTMYAGLRLFGVWGMILAPLVAAGIVSVVRER